MGGKKTLFLLLAGLAFTTGLLFYSFGADAWQLWNIPAMSPSFADTRSILAGVEAKRLGYDPLYENPLDPFGRVMAYPRLWLFLDVFNLNQNDTVFVVTFELILFFTGVFIFLDRFDVRSAFFIALFVASPAAMLCFERANNDLVAFFILACALALVPFSAIFSLLLIELAAFLKLYPVVALGALIREPKKSLVPHLIGGVAIFALYVFLTWRDIHRILFMAPKGAEFNYGATVIGLRILDVTGSRLTANVIFLFSYLFLYALLIFLLYLVNLDHAELPVKNSRALDAFRLGALIYIGTFLQGNTWNYRLIFLVFAIPQLVEWAHVSKAARITLALVMVCAWTTIFEGNHPGAFNLQATIYFSLDEISNWGLLAGMAYLLFASFPDWMLEEIHRFFRKYHIHSVSLSS